MSGSNVHGRVALVTGGGSGIGRATCQLLAKEGAKVVVADSNFQGAQDTVSMLSGNHLALKMDVTDKSSVDDGLRTITQKYHGPPSLLVNSAGIVKIEPFVEVEEKDFTDVIDVNLKGTFLVSQAVTKALLSEKGSAKGAIVNLASISGRIGSPGYSPYAASKGGVIAFTKSCAEELIKKGIRVNCIAPGFIKTPMSSSVPQELLDAITSQIPIGRPGQPEEVAEVIVFLLSEKSSYMVGSCVEVTGGFFM